MKTKENKKLEVIHSKKKENCGWSRSIKASIDLDNLEDIQISITRVMVVKP